ncbi:MAG: peptide deformylase, partial [Erysipelotrichaceae bacterium]|nr:peptide deformylase [Erysipelotrichaceae bacterium]
MKIVSDKNKKIRLRSKDIPFPLEANIINLGREMLQYLKNSQDDTFLKAHPEVRSGVGLAAPQIGHNIRMFAVLFTFKDESYEYVLINPKIIKES